MGLISQVIKMVSYSLIVFVNTLRSYWPLIIWPEILRTNFGVTSITEQTLLVSYYYISYNMGNIVSSFLWPYIAKKWSVKTCITIALFGNILTAALFAYMPNMYAIIGMRAVAGFFKNSNSVGKSFVYEFCEDRYRQYGFSFLNLFSFLAVFVGPMFGFSIYNWTGKNYWKCWLIVCFLYTIMGIFYYIVFYLTYIQVENASTLQRSIVDEEEKKGLISKHRKKKEMMGFFEAFFFIIKAKSIRGYVLVFVLAKSVNKALTVISVFYLEANWNEEGMGISSKTLSYLNLLVSVPVMLLTITIPSLVPKYFGYKTFLTFILLLYTFNIMMMPALKQIIGMLGYNSYYWLILINQGMVYCTRPKIFTPFINYLINKGTSKRGRVAVNSVNSILLTSFICILMNIISPLYSYCVHGDLFKAIHPFNLYLPFGFLASLILLAIVGINTSG